MDYRKILFRSIYILIPLYILSLLLSDIDNRENQFAKELRTETSGFTALHHAVAEKDYNKVKLLLAATKKDINARDDFGRTPLYVSLVPLKLNENYKSDYNIDKRSQMAMLLVEQQADINIADNKGNTILNILATDIYRSNIEVKKIEEKQNRIGDVFKSIDLLGQLRKRLLKEDVEMKTNIMNYLIKKGAKIDESMLSSPIYNKPGIIDIIKEALHKQEHKEVTKA